MSGEARVFPRLQAAAHDRAKYSQNFFRRVPVVTPTYEADEADLLPQPKKIGRMTVGLADAAPIKIKTEGPKRVMYEAEPRPEITFQGKLTIQDITDETDQNSAAAVETNNTEEIPSGSSAVSNGGEMAEATTYDGSVHLPVTHVRGRSHLHSYSKKEQAELTPLLNPDGIIGMQRARVINRNPLESTLKVDSPVIPLRATASPFVVGVVALTTFVITVGIVGMYGKISSDGTTALEQYGFTVHELVLTIRQHISALIVHSFIE